MSIRTLVRIIRDNPMTIMNQSGIKRKFSINSLDVNTKAIESDMILENGNKKIALSPYDVPLYTGIKDNIDQQEEYDNDDLKQIGYFGRLPEEILIKIFRLLPIEQLSRMTMTNSKIRNFIIKFFLLSRPGFLFLIRTSQFDIVDVYEPRFISESQKLFARIGLLTKRSTFLFRTNDRIDMIIHIMESSYGIPSIRLLSNQDYAHFKLIIKCYSKLMNTFIQGWRDFECEKMFHRIKDVCEIDLQIQKILNNTLGSKQKQELLVRNFFRMIFAHPYDSLNNLKEKIGWLMKTANVYALPEMARLFIVIFGPLVSANNNFYSLSLPYIAWWDLADSNFTEKSFEDLGLTLYFLYLKSEEFSYTKDFLIELIDRIIMTPTRWTAMNVSEMLYYAGFELSLAFFSKKIKEGYVHDVSTQICHLNVVTYKNAKDLTSIAKMIEMLVNENGTELIQTLPDAFSAAFFDVEIMTDEDHIEIYEISDIIESQLELMKIALMKCYQNLN
ncbi:F-box domain containing protein [Euroglyphus maynei]|uniref:F-box domain containing protein n=1 Tax=Euroglyphus maynei TaxID=6958 RepID=A0A1Y3ATZ1_EURMA|nr:F-box domain containing protein [Euroglyphus maynei]